MRSTRTAFSLVTVLVVTACTNRAAIKPAVEQVPVNVAVPVATGCIATTGRPALVVPLKSALTTEQWNKLAPGAKAAAVQVQAGERMNNADLDRVATSACM